MCVCWSLCYALSTQDIVNASIVKFGTGGNQHIGVVSSRGLEHKAPGRDRGFASVTYQSFRSTQVRWRVDGATWQCQGDRLHFSSSAADELGKRYAWKLLELTGWNWSETDTFVVLHTKLHELQWTFFAFLGLHQHQTFKILYQFDNGFHITDFQFPLQEAWIFLFAPLWGIAYPSLMSWGHHVTWTSRCDIVFNMHGHLT